MEARWRPVRTRRDHRACVAPGATEARVAPGRAAVTRPYACPVPALCRWYTGGTWEASTRRPCVPRGCGALCGLAAQHTWPQT